ERRCFFSSSRRHTRSKRDWSSDVCSSDLHAVVPEVLHLPDLHLQQDRGADEEQGDEGHEHDGDDHREVPPQARPDLGEDEAGPHEATPYVPSSTSRTIEPSLSSMTRRRIRLTISPSWVAMSTVVPLRLIFSRTLMMSALVVGSRLPVGSSASRMPGLLTTARAIATRCCSPPDSSLG